MADERVEKAKSVASYPAYTEQEHVFRDALRELISAYDDLHAARDRDIREAVEIQRGEAEDRLKTIDREAKETGHYDEARGIRMAIDELRDGEMPETDPATIRREERERIAAAARDTQRWVSGNYPAWAHEMFRQFAAAVENGDIAETKEENNAEL